MADELSRCLRERRRQAGRTLRDIADATGYSVQHISEIERGTRYAPDPSIMRQWVERLGGPDQDAVVDLARRGELMRSEAGRETLAERDALAARVAALVAAGDALYVTVGRLYNPDDRMTIMDALALARMGWRAARAEAADGA